MTANPIESVYRRTWWALVLRGLLGLTIGILILWRPLDSIAGFALAIAIWALFNGTVQIVHAFELKPVFSGWWVTLLSGIVSVGFGVAAIYYYPVLSLTYAVVCTAWWLLFTGGIAVYAAVEERRHELPWGWTLTFGLVSIATGVFAIAYPPATLAAIMGLIAGFGIVSGVALLVGAFRLSSAKREVTGALHSAGAF
jgi:uncharacterized membrane protein HdeD (DUF308 family)